MLDSTALISAVKVLGSEVLAASAEVFKLIFGVLVIGFAYLLKYTMDFGRPVYDVLRPAVEAVSYNGIAAPEWLIPSVAAFSPLALILLLAKESKHAFRIYSLLLGPAVMIFLFDSVATGIAVWVLILVLSKVSVGVHIDKKIPIIILHGNRLKNQYIKKTIPDIGGYEGHVYGRYYCANLGGYIVPLLLMLYFLNDVRDHIVAGTMFPFDAAAYLFVFFIFIAVTLSVVREPFVGIVENVMLTSTYTVFLMFTFSAGIPSFASENWAWIVKLAFASLIFASAVGADIIKETLFELKDGFGGGVLGGGGELDAVIITPVISAATFIAFKSLNILRTAPTAVSVPAVLAVYALGLILLLYMLIAWVQMACDFWRLLLPMLLAAVLLVFVSEKAAVTLFGILVLLVMPTLSIYAFTKYYAVGWGMEEREHIEEIERRKICELLKRVEEVVEKRLWKAGIDRSNAEWFPRFTREYAAAAEEAVRKFICEARKPHIRRLKMKIAVSYLPECPLKEELKKELGK